MCEEGSIIALRGLLKLHAEKNYNIRNLPNYGKRTWERIIYPIPDSRSWENGNEKGNRKYGRRIYPRESKLLEYEIALVGLLRGILINN